MRARSSMHGLTMKRPAHSGIDIRQSIHPAVSLPASLCPLRHGLGTPGWVIPKSGLLTQTQPHMHALTHAPTHTLTHTHTHLLVLQVIPTTAQSLNVIVHSLLRCASLASSRRPRPLCVDSASAVKAAALSLRCLVVSGRGLPLTLTENHLLIVMFINILGLMLTA